MFFVTRTAPSVPVALQSDSVSLLRKVMLGTALAVAANAASAATQLNVGTVVWIGYGPFYVAEAMDMFKKNGALVQYSVA